MWERHILPTGGFPSLWTCSTCCASAVSASELATSKINHIKSNRLRRAAGRLILSCGVAAILYLPNAGLAAARTAVRAFKVVVIPAFSHGQQPICSGQFEIEISRQTSQLFTVQMITWTYCRWIQPQIMCISVRQMKKSCVKFSCLRDANSLLLHDFVNCCTITLVHLVEFVYAADPIISED